MSSPAKVISVAKSFVDKDYKEGRNNDSLFGKWYGLNHQPWCAMFVSYCFNEAGLGKLVAASSPKGFASCTAGSNWFKKHDRLLPAKEAQPGDVIFMAFDGDLSDADHVGICYKVDHKKKLIYTYEGNTIDPSGRGSQVNGDGCYAKVRSYRNITGVGRPAYPAASPVKPVEAPKAKPATTTPKPAPKPATKPTAKTYTVKAGDSYWKIAEHHPVKGFTTNETIRLYQKLNNNKPLHPGDKITIK